MYGKYSFKDYLNKEVYWPYYEWGTLNIFKKVWCRYFRTESNSCFLVRKYLYHSHNEGGYHKLLSKYYQMKLLKRYGIWLHPDCDVDIGFRIIHPNSIFITNCQIGKNFTVFQNTNVGVKKIGMYQRENCPIIGDDVIMYANSSIVGNVVIANGTIVAGHACVVKNTKENTAYVGVPAKAVEKY